MRDYKSLAHIRWECKSHIVWVPKYRQKKLDCKVRRKFGEIIRDLSRQKGVDLIEGHAVSDHVHLCLSFQPKYSIAYVVGFLKEHNGVTS